MENKQKRFYKIGEFVWSIKDKQEAKVKSIDTQNTKATITVKQGERITEKTVNLWEIDKLKYGKEKKYLSNKNNTKIPKKYNPDEMYWMVRKFHKAFSHPVADKPTQMDEKRVAERFGYMLEELYEFKDAETLVDQADALIDLMYFTLGTFVEIGVRPFNLFKIVQEANMSKLWEDGKPRYREEDMKVLKPEGWQPPEPKLKAEIKRQSKK